MNIFSPDSIYYEHFHLLWLTTSYHLAQGLDNPVDLEGVLYEVRCPELPGMTGGDMQLMTKRVITVGAVNAGGVEGCRKALIDALQQMAHGRFKHVDVRADDEKYKELSAASPSTGGECFRYRRGCSSVIDGISSAQSWGSSCFDVE